MNFLRIVKEHESAEVLLQSTLLLYVGYLLHLLPPPWYYLRIARTLELQEELYATQTPITSPQFYECLLSSSRSSAPFTPARLAELLALASSSNAKETMLDLGKYAWTKRGAFAVPWMVAYKVPFEGSGKAAELTKEGRESDVFMGVDRFDALAYLCVCSCFGFVS